MRSFLLVLCIGVAGCASAPAKSKASATPVTEGEPPAPRGIERSLVLVDETAPAPPRKPLTDDALSTRRIVEKVLADSPAPAVITR